MYARLCILKGSPARIDKGLPYLREEVLFSLVDLQSILMRLSSSQRHLPVGSPVS